MQTAVVIVAAGRGTRMSGGTIPKQYRKLHGIPVLTRAISSFVEHAGVDAILTVIHEDDRSLYDEATGQFAPEKVLQPVHGGDSRQASALAGLEELELVGPRNVLIHDAARPFAPPGVIDRVLDGLSQHDGAVPALPVTDTIKRAAEGVIEATVDRSNLWRAQTPQGFGFDKILEAHRAAAKVEQPEFTDDASLAEWHGLDVVLVDGDNGNIKLTSDNDFERAEETVRRSSGMSAGEMRVGQGFDVHAFAAGDHVVLCGLKIPHDKALSGHSDADVALHAVTDALLGAIADGDIGAHFPPSDAQWQGAASDLFLKDAAKRVRDKGAEIVNVDLTVICERPKIGPHRDAMRARLAEILALDVNRVSVKATTTEGLGFTGRGEGIAAQATVIVRFWA